MIPDLPTANYEVWVRGYGLVDSPRLRAKPGQNLDLSAVPAPSEVAAAHYYPAIYWFVMMKLPPQKDFGGSTDIPKNITFDTWRKQMNNVDCIGCHQIGQEATRTVPAQFGKFKSGEDAWIRRISSGQAGEMMTNRLAGQFGGVPYKYLGDWTDRVANGELPKNKPARPAGLERNLVVTTWDWSAPDKYMHDLVSTDRRNPTVNGNGLLYGSPEYSTDNSPLLDPKTNEVSFFKMPVADPGMPVSLGPGHAGAVKPAAPSAYWGDRSLWDTRANNHNSMYGADGRVWLAATVRGMDNPAWCKKGSDNESAKVFPIDKSPRQAAVLNLKTKEYQFIDTCFGTHHPQFGYDADNTLWMSGTGPVAGWINTKVWDESHDAQKAVGWFPFVADTTGNGKLDEFTEPGKPEAGQGHAHQCRLRPLCGDAESEGRLDLVYLRHVRRRRGLPALRSEDQAERALSAAQGGHRRPRRRHRLQRRGVRLRLRRPVDRLRPQQVQRPAERPERRGRKSSARRASRSPTIRARASPNCRTRRRRRATTPSSTSMTPSASARTCRSRPPICGTASPPW